VTGKVIAGGSVIQMEAVDLVGFDNEKHRFKAIFADGRRKLVPRVYLCFDHEDHRNWLERFAAAWWKRVMACSLLKKNCFLEAMPTEHLSELSSEQKKKVEDLIRKNKKLEYSEITALMMEASKEYQLTMNNIIFDVHMTRQPDEMVPHHLVLP
jgi:dynein heavy chain